MRFALGFMVLAALAQCPALLRAADKDKDAPTIKCPVTGRAATKDVAVDYRGAKVYLCCPGCTGKFQEQTAKFAAKANLQLAQTGQAVQKACPLSGGKTNPDTAIKVCGVSVAFCCNNCKGKVSKAKAKAQVEMVFGDKAFDKAFAVKGQ
jgi:hypothetical protein